MESARKESYQGGSADVLGRNAVASHDVTFSWEVSLGRVFEKRIKICVFLSTKLNFWYPVNVLHSASMRTISGTWDFFFFF